jgi:hypothetical protein
MPANVAGCPRIGSLLLTHASRPPLRSDNCVSLLNTLGESCRNALLKGITGSDNQYIAKYGEEFFSTCSGIEGVQTASAPSADAPVVDTPVVDTPVVDTPVVEKPVEIPVEKPVELPTELPSTGVSNIAVATPVILGVLAMI